MAWCRLTLTRSTEKGVEPAREADAPGSGCLRIDRVSQMWCESYMYRLAVVALVLAAVGHGVGSSLGHAATTPPATANYSYDDPAQRVQGEYSDAIRVSLHRVASSGDSASSRFVQAAGVAAEEGAALEATPAGRVYSAHYLNETGPVRNIPGSVVDETIDHGQVVEKLPDFASAFRLARARVGARSPRSLRGLESGSSRTIASDPPTGRPRPPRVTWMARTRARLPA